MKIWTVDAFAKKPFTGNPAAVMIVDEFFQDALSQKIANEMNLSETAFVKPLGVDHFHLRWFTPTTEVKLCGHATLATAHILYQENKVKGHAITFDSLSGPLKVYKNNHELTLDFPLQATQILQDKTLFEQTLGLDIVQAATALDDLIIEIASPQELRNLKVSPEKINTFDCRGVIITAKGDEGYDFISRFFAPRVGVSEDPVTGSAHCKLAHYWQQKLGQSQFNAYQASSRGGELKILIKDDRVHITGTAITMLQGELQVDINE
ncbi:MAG: PhzF family phenazine biosynthesis protein [Legionellales bacterium]|jgi:PhzF family phenazine biosynthesis protein